jgi:hypothetical protein
MLSYYRYIANLFFTIPASGAELYAIGVSDPDMEIEKAKELAIIWQSRMLYCFRCQDSILQIFTRRPEDGRYTNLRQRFDTYFRYRPPRLLTQ